MSNWDIYSDDNISISEGFQESFVFEEPIFDKKIQSSTPSISTTLTTSSKSDFPFNGLPYGEMSEFCCSKDVNVLPLLLHMIQQSNIDDRWITLISPPEEVDSTLFAEFGIDASRVLMIHPKADSLDNAVVNKALKMGTSGIVIAWTENLPTKFFAQFRKSVKQGHSTGVLIHSRIKAHRSRSIALSIEVEFDNDIYFINKSMQFGKSIKQNSVTQITRSSLFSTKDKSLFSAPLYGFAS